MKRNGSTKRMGMAILSGGLAFVGSTGATELIQDGSFENIEASSSPIVKVGGKANPGIGEGWSTFSTYLYSTQYTMPGPENSGANYLRPYAPGAGGIPRSSTEVTQRVSLTSGTTLTPAKIDAGQGKYTMSAWFSSYLLQGDYSDLTLEFLNDAGAVVGDPVPLGGSEFVVNIPTGSNSKYGNAKEFAQDSRSGTIPAGARVARVFIKSTAVGGQPDGYVDVVSLDVTDAALSVPAVTSTDPNNNAVGVGPVVNLSLTIQDRTTALNQNSIQLFLDDQPVTATSIQKVDVNTTVKYAAGVLPPLSAHTFKVVFEDNGSPATKQTNEIHFTVANYLTLPASLGTPLGSEDTSKPGFDVKVWQVDAIEDLDPPAVQRNLPGSISFLESVLSGGINNNVAELSLAASGNSFVVPGVVNWVNASGVVANFPDDSTFPGIPGTTGSEDNFVHELLTYVRFPAAGYYQMGVNNEDAFRLTAARQGQAVLRIIQPANSIPIPAVAIGTNITTLQFGGALPTSTPLVGDIFYATPDANPESSCALAPNANLVGKILLIDIGESTCNSADKALKAQQAGAIAVLLINTADQGFPYRIGDLNTQVTIPVLAISSRFGGSGLKTALAAGTQVTASIQADANPRLAEWDGPKGFGAVDVSFGFAVPAAGLYPLRLLAGQEAGNANLEWFSIKPDGTRILLNDTSNPDALRAFRARNEAQPAPVFATPFLSGTGFNFSWTGGGTLEETADFVQWTTSPSQVNPQAVPATSAAKFYRVRR